MLKFNMTNFLLIKRSLLICKLSARPIISDLDTILADIKNKALLTEELVVVNNRLNERALGGEKCQLLS